MLTIKRIWREANKLYSCEKLLQVCMCFVSQYKKGMLKLWLECSQLILVIMGKPWDTHLVTLSKELTLHYHCFTWIVERSLW